MSSKRWPYSEDGERFTRSDIFILLGILFVLLIPALGIVIKARTSERILLPVSFLALFGGLLFEYRRIAQKWSTVLLTSLTAFGLSYLVFIPGKKEVGYNFEHHVGLWPYAFCSIFLTMVVFQNRKRVTIKLHEGMTMIQTLALAYWIVDVVDLRSLDIWKISTLCVFVIFGLYSVLNAFLPLTLSTTNRFVLSLWSSMVMIFLGLDNINRIYGLGYIEQTEDPHAIALIVGNYFLLGASSIYMVQHLVMMLGFIPGWGDLFLNSGRGASSLIDEHAERYSEQQLPIGTGILCLIYASAIFGLNYHFDFVRSNFIIWGVFVTFPIFLKLTHLLSHFLPFRQPSARRRYWS